MRAGLLRGHALTSLEGRFLSVDAVFAEIVGREAATLSTMTILDVTHAPDRRSNHASLERLRRTGQPFEITKRYRREDGTLVLVRNQVASLRDGAGPMRLVASVEALNTPDGAASEFDLFAIASTVQQAQARRSQSVHGVHWSDEDWGLMLASYVLEQRGGSMRLAELCALAAIDESGGYLIVLKLVNEGWLTFDHVGAGLPDSSAVLTVRGRELMTHYLGGLLTG